MVTAHTSVLKNFHSLSLTKQNSKIWKDRAHEYFDIIWEKRKYVERNVAYDYLGNYLGKCPHMSNMSNTTCKETIKWSIDILNEAAKLERKFGMDIHGFIEYPEYLETI